MASPVSRGVSLWGTNHELANEGTYFVAKNPAIDTGLATIAAPIAWDGTKPYIAFVGPTTKGKRLFIDYLRLRCTAPGTAGAKMFAEFRIDPIAQAAPAGGTQLALNCTNTDCANNFESQIWAGANTSPADSLSVRDVIATFLKGSIPAINDVFTLKFGGTDQGVSTTANLVYYGGPPMIIGAGCVGKMGLIIPAQTAASSFEIEIGGWER